MDRLLRCDKRLRDGSCPTIDPDVAGIGVIISLTVASASTIAIFIAGNVLDNLKRFQQWNTRRFKLWRSVLDSLTITFADQQLLTCIALLISVYSKSPTWTLNLADSHVCLAVYSSMLCAIAYASCIERLRSKYTRYGHFGNLILKTRTVIYACFTCIIACVFLFDWFSASLDSGNMPIALMWISYVSLTIGTSIFPTVKLLVDPSIHGPYNMTSFSFLFWYLQVRGTSSEPCIGGGAPNLGVSIFFLGQFLLLLLVTGYFSLFQRKRAPFSFNVKGRMISVPISALSVAEVAYSVYCGGLALFLVYYQRFGDDHRQDTCCLKDFSGNHWGLGQTLALFLLALPVMNTVGAYVEARHHHAKEFVERRDALSHEASHGQRQQAAAHASDIELSAVPQGNGRH